MKSQTVTPATLFSGSVRYEMPMFQRPYVWDEDGQWVPLWEDIRRVAGVVLEAGQHTNVPPHFLGAIVTEQESAFGSQVMTVIDGQQRLTTLQLLIDAAERVVTRLGEDADARALSALILNRDTDGGTPQDGTRFKVWPTNRDREAFEAAMDDARPVAAPFVGTRLVRAHDWFEQVITDWATQGPSTTSARLAALVKTLRSKLSIVGITLDQGDNAQMIFETLNFRGTPLLAADLVKNHLFQRAEAEGLNVDVLYAKYWKTFDGDDTDRDYWRVEVRQGRLKRPRIDQFLGHWLVMKLGQEVASDRIFTEFRDSVANGHASVEPLLAELHRDAVAYRAFMDAPVGSREELFRYRVLEALDANAVMPAVLWVLAHPMPVEQRRLVLESLESWLVRRALLRLGTKDYTHFTIELVRRLRDGGAQDAGQVVRDYLAQQTTPARLWPDDASLREQLRTAPVYRTLKRSVVRMLLEAVEMHLREHQQVEVLTCPRDLSVEHVMPQSWQQNWPLPSDDDEAVARRDALVQTLGNLTLVTGAHNSSLSNRAWLAPDAKGKRDYIDAHSVLMLRQGVVRKATWDESVIESRGAELADAVLLTWPRPQGGASTKDLLASPVKERQARHSTGEYEIHGPDFSQANLPRRVALRELMHRVHEAGVPMQTINDAVSSVRLRVVEGTLRGSELFERLKAEPGVNPDHPEWWWLEHPIHEDGRTWVFSEDWGNGVHGRMDTIASLAEGVGWSTTSRGPGAQWTTAEVMEALAGHPEWQSFVAALTEGIEALGGRVRGTAAEEPSMTFGVPGDGGMVWMAAFYTGQLDRPLRLGFRSVFNPQGADEAFLARVESVLPSVDAAAIRAAGFHTWPSVAAPDLLAEGTAVAVAHAAEEYLGAGDGSRWWCIHNDTIPGDELRAGGFVSLGWDQLGDLGELGSREAIVAQLREAYPGEKEGAYTNWSSMLLKFAHELQPGDLVISPVKASRTVDIGVVCGEYRFEESAAVHKHRLSVEWRATGLPRDGFSQTARHEIGGALTLFRVRRTVDEFSAALQGSAGACAEVAQAEQDNADR